MCRPRSLRDGLNILCDCCDNGLRVVPVTLQIDFNGATDRMLAALLLGVAQLEQETRRDRQAAGSAAAKDRGVYAGRKPGCTRADPERVKELRATGLTVQEIARFMGVSRFTVYRYLKATVSG